ncbi:MAG: succinylglutamate desuccinylase/aspartoacylase family protein [Thermoanaerobaculia bacterium]
MSLSPPDVAPAPAASLPASLPELPRVLGDVGSPAAGNTLVVLGGVHGNEPSGVEALRRVLAQLDSLECALHGRLLGLVGNRAALAAGRRFLQEDLNRIWLPERLERARDGASPSTAEERELGELDRLLDSALEQAHGRTFVLDLHTTSGPGPAFVVVHDTLRNRAFGRAMNLPLVFGLEEELSGTLTDHLTDRGAISITVETGQHRSAASADRAEAAIWLALDVAGLAAECHRPEVEQSRQSLAREVEGLPPAVEGALPARHRRRRRVPNGSRLRQLRAGRGGQVLAEDVRGPVASPRAGRLLMPLYQALGDDGFFVTRPVRESWLRLSTTLRRWRLERFLHWLPGIREVPERSGVFMVDRRVARWLALEIFHLLGFRRLEATPSHLIMARRVNDREA